MNVDVTSTADSITVNGAVVNNSWLNIFWINMEWIINGKWRSEYSDIII